MSDVIGDISFKRINDFEGFANNTLLESGNIPIAKIAELTIRESHSSNPLYGVHRWFARRSGSEFRSILTGLSLKECESDKFWGMYFNHVPLDGAIVLDPFVGGGTSLIEASHCNAYVIGYDIDPIATFITRFELEAYGYDYNEAAIDRLDSPIITEISKYHKTYVEGIGEREVLHHFWVECRVCEKCGENFEVHPHYQLAYNKEKGIQWVFCRKCHVIYELPIQRKELRCGCGKRTKILEGTLSVGKVRCPCCNNVTDLSNNDVNSAKRPKWELFAQEYIDRTLSGVTRCFKKASDEDKKIYAEASRALNTIENTKGPFTPLRQIPSLGRLDQRPIIHGFKKYRDLFNDRQLLHLTLLGKAISEIDDEIEKRILSLAFSEHLTTNCMYTAYAFGYRRVSPLFSIHSYRHITRPTELNPWLEGIGRGTFPNTLRKVKKAIIFSKAPRVLDLNGKYNPISNDFFPPNTTFGKDPSDVINNSQIGIIVNKSSEKLDNISNGSIDLILTDPPYFDNINYSELSDFYLAWHQVLGIVESSYSDLEKSSPMSENLAVTNHSVAAITDYQSKLQNIFKECYRVLKDNGLLVFTYHHKSAIAWCKLGESLIRSGFKCTAVIPLRGEGNGGFHSYSGTIKWDAVFVCRKGVINEQESNFSDPIMVPIRKITEAKRKANEYYEVLKDNINIGFREPDLKNLERAMIVASSMSGKCLSDALPLYTALK
jgi:adenine-specific DNA methylase